jgi:hypothetical protein
MSLVDFYKLPEIALLVIIVILFLSVITSLTAIKKI